ncbi:MAG: hypothetical protein FWB89_08050 [Treponema sp.]|nr:hypothetical protein [Treponema sp.]
MNFNGIFERIAISVTNAAIAMEKLIVALVESVDNSCMPNIVKGITAIMKIVFMIIYLT